MEPSLLRKEFVSCLVDLVSLGINNNKLEDAEAVLTAVRALRPRLAELNTFDAWICMKRGFWADAIRHLRDVDDTAANWWLGKALLAFCQFATGDPMWNASANDVVQHSDSTEAIGLVRLLLHPEEVESPLARSEEPEPLPRQPAAMHHQSRYVRG